MGEIMTSTLFLHLCLAIGQGRVPRPGLYASAGVIKMEWPELTIFFDEDLNYFDYFRAGSAYGSHRPVRDTAHLDELLKEISTK